MPHTSPQAAPAVIDIAPHRAEPHEPSEGVAGPGWFDSSWELHRGLEVRESWSDDDRVDGWIADFLRTQRTIGRTASPSASTAMA